MNTKTKKELIKKGLNKNNGILRLAPSWVTRNILLPGKRLKLDPRDLYARGFERGAICERWMASTGMVDNGDLTAEYEGLSFIVIEKSNGDYKKILLKDAIEILGDKILGSDIMNEHGGLTAFAKFYDFSTPIPHHVHLKEKDAQKVEAPPKPESYYFPVQLNNIDYNSAYTYFGLEPGTTKDDIIKCLKKWDEEGDNGILEYSKAYKLKLGTGWNVPAGILHAPGSLVTYEPQRMSDTSLFFQSKVEDTLMDKKLLTKFVPEDKHEDYEYIVNVLDWEANLDTDFKKNHYHEPVPVENIEKMKKEGYREEWISYGSDQFSAKKLTVFPDETVTINDSLGYGFVMMEGYGTINGVKIETPSIIRFNEITSDEMFVTRRAAEEGVTITNLSNASNIVMLKHFGPGNKDAKKFLD